MSLDTALATLKSAADPTRLRLLGVLGNGEATVGELQAILDQSQPRVSRHLRLLGEAGLVSKFRDGQSIYYRLAEDPATRELVELIDRLAGDDPLPGEDRDALLEVQREREREVFSGSRHRLLTATVSRAGRPDARAVAELIEEALGDRDISDALDIGCGGGALLEGLAMRTRHVVGIDTAKNMRLLARSRLHQAGLANCTVRNADMHALPFNDDSFDVVLLDEVLGFTADVDAVLRESARALRRNGHLLVFDRVLPVARRLPAGSDGALIENQLAAALKSAGFRVRAPQWLPGRAPEYALVQASPAGSAAT